MLWAGQYFGQDQSDVKITRTVYECKGYGHVRHSRGCCELETWRRWAATAEVVKRAKGRR